MTRSVPVVVLAAGASRRLGSAKQLVRFGGRTLLAHAVATAQEAGCGPVLVVLGAGFDAFRAEIADPAVRVVANPDWASGMGSSVRVAIATISAEIPNATAALFTVCDQPLVTADLLAQIARTHGEGHDLVAASYHDAVGVPALFARRFFGELQDLPGDAGARRVLARHANAVVAIPFEGGAIDVDTPADVARLAASSSDHSHSAVG